MAPATQLGLPLGIDGIQIFGSHLYFTNFFQQNGFFAKVPISMRDGSKLGKAVLVAKSGYGDDFAMDKKGNAWVTTNLLNGVQVIKPDGSFKTVVGGVNDTIVQGSTGAVFGRTRRDSHILYVSTNGGSAIPVPGTYRVGGTVVAIDTSRIHI